MHLRSFVRICVLVGVAAWWLGSNWDREPAESDSGADRVADPLEVLQTSVGTLRTELDDATEHLYRLPLDASDSHFYGWCRLWHERLKRIETPAKSDGGAELLDAIAELENALTSARAICPARPSAGGFPGRYALRERVRGDMAEAVKRAERALKIALYMASD